MRHLFGKRNFPFLLLLMTALSFSASAQNISGDDIKAQFVKDWERSKAYTLEYLNAMPADKYSFKAVDSIRSFAQQMLHLAMGNNGLINAATGAPVPGATPGQRPRNLEAAPGAQSKDSVVYFVTASYDYAINSIKAFDASKLGEVTGNGPRQATRFAWLNKAFEHQAHTLGQTTIYIRLEGIRPPGEKLF
ncbi:MAG TPA: DinB family protein [Puia sp.]|jgi:hypothetical protein|nr:DinB family protein [Puia sp.]